MTRLLAALFAALLLTPALAPAQPLTREVALSAPESGIAFGEQSYPVLTSDGNGFYGVWIDGRSGESQSIYGSRLTAEGVPLETKGVQLSSNRLVLIGRPTVVWTGRYFLAAWSEGLDVVGRRIDRDGRVLDAEPVVLRSGVSSGGHMRSAAAGGDVALMAGSTLLIVGDDLRIKASYEPQPNFLNDGDVAADGNDFVLLGVSSPPGALVSIPVTRNGVAGPRTTIADGREVVSRSRLTFASSRFFVTWFEGRTATPNATQFTWRLRARFLDRGGLPLGETMTLREDVRGIQPAAMAAGGDDTVLVIFSTGHPERADESGDLYSLTVREGSASEARPIRTSALTEIAPALAAAGGDTLAVWQEGGYQLANLFGSRIDASGAPVSERTPITHSARAQQLAGVTKTRTNLVVWSETDGEGTTRIRARDLETSTAPAITVSATPSRKTEAAYAHDGAGTFAFTWYEQESLTQWAVMFARMRGGAVVDTVKLISTRSRDTAENPTAAPAVTWTGSTFLVVWSCLQETVRYVRINADGTIVDPVALQIAPPAPGTPQTHPVLATGGGITLVVWQEGQRFSYCPFLCPIVPPSTIRAVRFDASGTQLDTTPITVSPSDGVSHFTPDLAWNGSSFVVAWQSKEPKMLAARVAPFGVVLDQAPIVLAGAELAGEEVSVVAAGTDSIVAWDRNVVQGSRDIFVSRINALGEVTQQPARTTDAETRLPHLVPLTTRNALVYSRLVDVPRLFYRLFDPAPQPSYRPRPSTR